MDEKDQRDGGLEERRRQGQGTVKRRLLTDTAALRRVARGSLGRTRVAPGTYVHSRLPSRKRRVDAGARRVQISRMEPDSLNATQRAAQAQFSKQSQRYGKGHILENVEDVREAVGLLTLPAPAQVLDVACGAGHTGLYLASLGHAVTCADLSLAMLERTREAAAARGLAIETQEHPAEVMPYASGCFDLVTCRVAPHHFSDPAGFVAEAARVLRPSGVFLLIDGTVPDEQPEAGTWLNRVEKLRDPSHVQLYAPAQWRAWCEAAGLRVERHWLREKLQPDLEWYFETAATSPENRAAVRALIHEASPEIRAAYRLSEEEARITWQWPMLSLLARK
jgi:SAM-dependent methyltransferase